MTDNQCRLVFEYAGAWMADEKHMISAMNLMVEKGDWIKFENYAHHLYNDAELVVITGFIHWLMQPDRFFKLFGEWLEQREKEEGK
jgi:hypothetical protein